MSTNPEAPKADPNVGDPKPPESVEPPITEILRPGEGEEEPKADESFDEVRAQSSLTVDQSGVIEREQRGGQCEFLMSSIASAVGLANVVRFPLIAAENAGGDFLLAYLITLAVIGLPIYKLELGLGQFCSNGPIKIWEMAPGFRGVGIAAAVASFFVSTFYCVIMGWAILYLFYSMYPVLPWNEQNVTLSGITVTDINGSSAKFFGLAHLGVPAKDHALTDFWNGKGLDGPPVLNLAIALFVAWFMVWGIMIQGVSGSGKIAYFTALFSYVVLLILLVGGLTLKGSGAGIRYFFTPTWEKILKPQTWFQAVGQCFFSLGISFGGCIMFSSFNSFHHKLGRDIVIISIMDTFTSILAGTCLFSLIGNIALVENVTIESLTQNPGAGLAFVTFPNVLKAFGSYPGPNCISALFFFMIIVLAVGSANGLVGTTVTVICDYFPKWKRPIVVSSMCCTCFLLGLIYCCPTGNYVIDIVDKHGSELVVYVVGIFEVLGIVLVYGLKNVSNDFEFMLDGRVHMYWQVCWVTLPFLLIFILVAYLTTYTKDPKWPPIAAACAWSLTGLCWMILPIVAIAVIQTRKSHSIMKRFKASFLPTRKWGPKDPTIQDSWIRWKKGKPSEFKLTTTIKKKLGLSSNSDPLPDVVIVEHWEEQSTNNLPAAAHLGCNKVEIENGPRIPKDSKFPPEANQHQLTYQFDY